MACLPVQASGGWGEGGVAHVLPCSVSFIQGSDLSFEGLPEEAFEHLTNLNYLYLANNKVRALEGGVCCPALPMLSSAKFHELLLPGHFLAGCWV